MCIYYNLDSRRIISGGARGLVSTPCVTQVENLRAAWVRSPLHYHDFTYTAQHLSYIPRYQEFSDLDVIRLVTTPHRGKKVVSQSLWLQSDKEITRSYKFMIELSHSTQGADVTWFQNEIYKFPFLNYIECVFVYQFTNIWRTLLWSYN